VAPRAFLPDTTVFELRFFMIVFLDSGPEDGLATATIVSLLQEIRSPYVLSIRGGNLIVLSDHRESYLASRTMNLALATGHPTDVHGVRPHPRTPR